MYLFTHLFIIYMKSYSLYTDAYIECSHIFGINDRIIDSVIKRTYIYNVVHIKRLSAQCIFDANNWHLFNVIFIALKRRSFNFTYIALMGHFRF